MKTFLKIVRWTIIVLAVVSVLTVTGDHIFSYHATDSWWVAVFWLILGAAAWYFEKKSNKLA